MNSCINKHTIYTGETVGLVRSIINENNQPVYLKYSNPLGNNKVLVPINYATLSVSGSSTKVRLFYCTYKYNPTNSQSDLINGYFESTISGSTVADSVVITELTDNVINTFTKVNQ